MIDFDKVKLPSGWGGVGWGVIWSINGGLGEQTVPMAPYSIMKCSFQGSSFHRIYFAMNMIIRINSIPQV